MKRAGRFLALVLPIVVAYPAPRAQVPFAAKTLRPALGAMPACLPELSKHLDGCFRTKSASSPSFPPTANPPVPGPDVNSTGDQPAVDPQDFGCLTALDTCTLRAAIQTVNACVYYVPCTGPVMVNFDSKLTSGKRLPIIRLNSPLPAVSEPIFIAGNTDDAAAPLPGIIVDGSGAGKNANGVVVTARGSTIEGLALQKFDGAGIVLRGNGAAVQRCVLYKDHLGLEVASNKDTIGGTSTGDENAFFADGNDSAWMSFAASLRGLHVTWKNMAEALPRFGAGIEVTKSVKTVAITGNLIGNHGSDLGSALPPDDPGDPALVTPIGVLIAPANGKVSNIAIGEANIISGNSVGIAAVGFSTISGLAISNNFIGPASDGSALKPHGNQLGVLATGRITAFALGPGNTIRGNGVGAVIAGPAVAGSVSGNRIGIQVSLSSFLKSLSTGQVEGRHNVLGVLASDTRSLSITGNLVAGNLGGIILSGKASAANVVKGNFVGLRSVPPTGPGELTVGEAGQILGIADFGSTGNRIGTGSRGNTLQANALGISLFGTSGEQVQGNHVNLSGAAVFGTGASNGEIGGTKPSLGNTITGSGIGILMAAVEVPSTFLQAKSIAQDSFDQSERQRVLNQPAEQLSLTLANALTEPTLGPQIVDDTSQTGIGNVIQSNWIGTNSSGSTTRGNETGILLLGNFRKTLAGTTNGVGGNTIAHNRSGGIVLIGLPGLNPSAGLPGNIITDNHHGGSNSNKTQLGIDLAEMTSRGAFVRGYGLGPNDLDAKQPDNGPNGLQNFPVIGSAIVLHGTLTVKGTLNSSPSAKFGVQLYADSACNNSGYGEGDSVLQTITVMTPRNGVAAFSASFKAPSTGLSYVTATATAASGTGSTSEFSKCAAVKSK